MKKTITLLLLHLMCCVVYAQEYKLDYQYQPFAMDGSCKWINAEPYYASGTVNHITNEDTIINDKTYKKIYDYTCEDPSIKTYRGAVREENKEIYYVSKLNDINNEYKIFDFNFKVGDRMNYTHPENFHINNYMIIEVSKIDTIKFNNTWRRVYSFIDYTRNDPVEWKDAWIEGIGAEHDFLTPFTETPTCCGGISSLCGVVQNETSIHGDCNCAVWEVGINNNEASQFKILCNPILNKILSIETGNIKFTQINIYSMEGISVLSRNISSHTANFDISLQNIEAGSYIVILTKENGGRESSTILIK